MLERRASPPGSELGRSLQIRFSRFSRAVDLTHPRP